MTCTVCAADVPEGIYLCHADAERLEYDLAETGAVWADLQTTVARLDKGASGVGSGGHAGSRPPVNLDASDRGQTLRVILTGWTQLLPGLHPTGEPDKVAAWLLGQVNVIRRMDWAGDLVTELRDALNACRRATDRAADRITLGTCGQVFQGIQCTDTVTAITGAAEGRCRTCGHTVNVREWQLERITSAWHVRATLPSVLRALQKSGHLNIPLKRVEHWVQRGKLTPVEGNLYTPAAVLAAYHETPTGKRAIA